MMENSNCVGILYSGVRRPKCRKRIKAGKKDKTTRVYVGKMTDMNTLEDRTEILFDNNKAEPESLAWVLDFEKKKVYLDVKNPFYHTQLVVYERGGVCFGLNYDKFRKIVLEEYAKNSKSPNRIGKELVNAYLDIAKRYFK